MLHTHTTNIHVHNDKLKNFTHTCTIIHLCNRGQIDVREMRRRKNSHATYFFILFIYFFFFFMSIFNAIFINIILDSTHNAINVNSISIVAFVKYKRVLDDWECARYLIKHYFNKFARITQYIFGNIIKFILKFSMYKCIEYKIGVKEQWIDYNNPFALDLKKKKLHFIL